MKIIKKSVFFLFLSLSFSLFATDWNGDILIDGKVPDGTQKFYKETDLKIQWSVNNENSGEVYWIAYSFNPSDPASWHSCRINSQTGPEENKVIGNGGPTYTVFWDTTTGLERIQENQPVVYIRVKRDSDNAVLLTVNSFGIYNADPQIDIRRPQARNTYSGTISIDFTVTNTWPDDEYNVEYSKDGGTTWNPITTVPKTTNDPANLSILWDTVAAGITSGTTFRIRITGTLSHAQQTTGDFTIDNNKITGIDIVRPTSTDKARGKIEITFKPQGTERLDEQYKIEYQKIGEVNWNSCNLVGIPNPFNGNGSSQYTVIWDTDNLNGKYKIRITATSSNFFVESSEFIIDNTPPQLRGAAIVDSNGNVFSPNGVIPDESNGHGGSRYIVFTKPSGWYIQYPRLKLYIEDPMAQDNSCAGIYSVTCRFGNEKGWGPWQIQTIAGTPQSTDVDFEINIEGERIGAEVVIIDDAQYSTVNPPNLDQSIYNSGGGFGNYSPKYSSDLPVSSPFNINNFLANVFNGQNLHFYNPNDPSYSPIVKIDVTPPQILSLEVRHLPDGPHIGSIHWYKTPPIITPSVTDNLSGVYTGACMHTIDGTTIPKINLTYNDEKPYISVDPLNGQIITFVSDAPGFKTNGLEIPVFNSYGKEVHVRVWDKAGNLSDEFIDNPWYKVPGLETQVQIYVDTVPPDTRVSLSGSYWPTSPLDLGTYERSYFDIWNNNRDFPRPEDAFPPQNYPQNWIDYIFIASNANTSVPPLSLKLNFVNSLYEIFDLDKDGFNSITLKRPFIILPGHPDWDIRYDFYFSDFKEDNRGSNISSNFNSPWYRYSTDTDNPLVDLKSIWGQDTNHIFAVGEKGVIKFYDGNKWITMVNDDSNNLYRIWGSSSNDVYAVGEIVLHYDGNSWSKINLPSSIYYGVWGTSSDNVYIVGRNGKIFHFNGINWNENDQRQDGL